MKACLYHSLVVSSLLSISAAASADSVNSWGPWQGVYTAAGPVGSVPLMLQFASANNLERYSNVGVEGQGGDGVDKLPGSMRRYANWSSETDSSYYDKRAVLMHSVNGQTATFTATSHADSVELEGPYYFMVSDQFATLGLSFNLERYKKDAGSSPQGFVISDEVSGHRIGAWEAPSGLPRGYFIEGYASPVSAIESLASNVLAGNATGYFFGEFLDERGSVHLKLSFGGSPSWEGNFSHQKFISFGAAGAINGSELVGTARGNGVAGTVEASIVGGNADAIIGMVDVANDRGKLVDVFHTVPATPQQVAEQYSGEFDSFGSDG